MTKPNPDAIVPYQVLDRTNRAIGGNPSLEISPELSSRLEALETDPQEHGRVAGRSIHNDVRLTVLFRHSGWKPDRIRVAASLARTAQPDSRRAAFQDCGSQAFVLRSIEDPSKYRIAGSGCHDRFCVPCAIERSRVIAHNVVELIEQKAIRFVTLTIRSTDDPLTDQLDKLYASFSALRRRAVWHKAVFGGVAFLELTFNKTRNQWHPHLHCLVDGTWIDGKRLKIAWNQITNGSYVIDIRRPSSNEAVGRYVAKYASKPINSTFLRNEDRLDEAVIALKGRKLCVTYGTWRGKLLTASTQEGTWEHVCSLEDLISQAASGDDECRAIMASLTGQDLTTIYERAPPYAKTVTPTIVADPQHTFFGTWNEDGSFRYRYP